MARQIYQGATPKRAPNASGKPTVGYVTGEKSAKLVARTKEGTGRPSGPAGPDAKPGVRFTLEERNRASWADETKGAIPTKQD